MRSETRLYLSPPHLGAAELPYVQRAFAANWVAPAGPDLAAFEAAICAYIGGRHCVALNSGTAAIHLGLRLLGIGPGDEVICPSFTFVATANPILYLGATPVFVDSEAITWNMCPTRLREAITDRIRLGRQPKAILLVHLYGMPARVRELLHVAAEFDIPVLEDAAEALGAHYDGQALGTFGAVGVFSFNGNKLITTGGGGALLTNDPALAARALFLATQAKDPAPHYQHSTLGYNYRLSNVAAAIGRGQMQVVAERVQQRRAVYAAYEQELAKLPALQLGPTEPAGAYSNRWLTTILLTPTRPDITPENLRLHLETYNIESRPLWKPLHQQPLFATAPTYGGDVCARLFERGLCLPSGSAMTTADVQRVAAAVREFLGQEQ